jgi:hypothetical protein
MTAQSIGAGPRNLYQVKTSLSVLMQQASLPRNERQDRQQVICCMQVFLGRAIEWLMAGTAPDEVQNTMSLDTRAFVCQFDDNAIQL